MCLVTIYVPCHNYGRYLCQAVDSILAQIFGDWQLFIVDDASEDDSRQIIQAYIAAYPEKIFGIYHDYSLGLQRTANEVLSKAAGKYFIRLDADDWLDPHALLLMVERLERDKNIDLVFSNYYLVNEAGEKLALEDSRQNEAFVDIGHHPAHGACSMVRTRTLKALGGYNEEVTAQDGWDLWYKLIRGKNALRISLPLFFYRQHSMSLSRDSDRLLAARRRIFKVLSENSGDYKPTVLAVIGVKEAYPNSAGIPFKRYKNTPLLEYVTREIAKSTSVTSLMISSQSSAVIEESNRIATMGLNVPVLVDRREINSSPDFLPLDGILNSALGRYAELMGGAPDIVMFCSLHAVNRKSVHIDDAINLLKLTLHDSVVSVQSLRDLVFKHEDSGLSVLNPGRFSGITKEREVLYRFNGAIFAVWTEVLRSGDLLGEGCGYIEMTPEESKIYIGDANGSDK